MISQTTRLITSKYIFFAPSRKRKHGRRRLEELGSLLALDILINNHDRVPTVWTNAGNCGNLIMSHEGKGESSQVLAIDQVITALNLNANNPIIEKNFAKLVEKRD